MLILTILFWLCVFGYIPYHFRKCGPVKEFFAGFFGFWLCIIHADDRLPNYHSDAFDYGGITALITSIIAALALLVLAAYTIYLAS